MDIKRAKTENQWDYENFFHWTSDPSRIGKILTHYELYKKIVNLPGDIIELGVFKMNSLIRWATFRNLIESEYSRKIYGFDMFGSFPVPSELSQYDKEFIYKHNEIKDIFTFQEALEIINYKNFKNVELIEGDIFDTLKKFISPKVGNLRIALLHLDLDLASPTTFALEQLWEYIVSGGIIVIDDYASVGSASDSIDKFIMGKNLIIKKGQYLSNPSYIVKP